MNDIDPNIVSRRRSETLDDAEIADGVTLRIARDGDGFKVYEHHFAGVWLNAESFEDQSWSENTEHFDDEAAAWARFEERVP